MDISYGTVNDAISLAHHAHAGQRYGDTDYTRHLRDVALILGAGGFVGPLEYDAKADDFVAHPLPGENTWQIAAWLHDIVEDTEVTIDQVREQFGPEVARLVAAVTTPASVGNRKARLTKLIEQLRETPEAMPLKLADRISNVDSCWYTRNTLLFMYHREYRRFRTSLRPLSDDPRVMKMWDRLDKLLGWWEPPPKEGRDVDP
jgi:(p)ppGpp synthase/HD superfamily hydrolase